jgi:class 3 adenylate cyclase
MIGINTLIIFVDIRGFTTWGEKVENAPFLDDFVPQWYAILAEQFSGVFIKHLGDGALIVREIESKTTTDLLHTHITRTLETIGAVESRFKALCKTYAEEQGTKIPLSLGWGIAKGPVQKINSDYIGSDINKCSRYCDLARPFGIVIDADDFPTVPQAAAPFALRFVKQTRILKGINDEAEVWVTKEVAEQFIPREEGRETPEVHVAGVCVKKENGVYYILLGKRNNNRRLYPGLYEGCGGQLARDELFTEGVVRHYKREYHVDVNVVDDLFLLYHICESSEPRIPGIRFLCEYLGGIPTSLNHIAPTPAWFSEEVFRSLPEQAFIPGLKAEMISLLEKYKARAAPPLPSRAALC